jgi:hypothetical protein
MSGEYRSVVCREIPTTHAHFQKSTTMFKPHYLVLISIIGGIFLQMTIASDDVNGNSKCHFDNRCHCKTLSEDSIKADCCSFGKWNNVFSSTSVILLSFIRSVDRLHSPLNEWFPRICRLLNDKSNFKSLVLFSNA